MCNNDLNKSVTRSKQARDGRTCVQARLSDGGALIVRENGCVLVRSDGVVCASLDLQLERYLRGTIPAAAIESDVAGVLVDTLRDSVISFA